MGAIHKSLIIYLWLTIDHTSRKNKPRHPSSVGKIPPPDYKLLVERPYGRN
jgi:hypothetical protein